MENITWIKGGKFTAELTENEIKELDEKDFAIYLKEYQDSKFEMATKAFEEKLKDVISKSDFEELKKALDKLNKEKEDDLEARIKEFEKLAEKISKKVDEKEVVIKEDNFNDALKKSWDGISKKFKDNPDIHSAEMSIKALPLTTSTWTGSSNYPFLQDDQEAGIASAPITPLTFVNDVQTLAPISANSDKWTWIERGTVTDGTNSSIAEGGAFGIVEVAYNKQETSVLKIGNYTKITREMLEDWNEFSMAVNELINELLLTTLNEDLFTAIKAISVEFDANDLETTTPGVWDVIRTTIAQIRTSGKTKWIPNKIYMNPIDVAEQDISKNTTGNYVFPPFIMPNGMQVKGIIITETTDVDAGYFEIADMNRVAKRFKRAIDIRVWEQNATDVQNDLLTITGSIRYAQRIKTVDYSAFVYDNFDAAIAILTTTAASLAMIIAATTGMAQNGIGDASKLTINLLAKAGVTSLTAATLPDYKTDVAAATSIADLSALQTIIDNA